MGSEKSLAFQYMQDWSSYNVAYKVWKARLNMHIPLENVTASTPVRLHARYF